MWTEGSEWVAEGDGVEVEDEQTTEAAEAVGIPASESCIFSKRYLYLKMFSYAERFDARDVRWAPDGKGLVIVDKETFCCAFEAN